MIEIKEDQLYTTKEVAAFFKTTTNSVLNMIKRKEIKGLDIGKGKKITGKSIIDFFNKIGD